MMIKCTEKVFKGYRVIELENKYFKAGIVPALGGKVLFFGTKEHELFFQVEKFDYIPEDINSHEDISELRKSLRYLPPGGYKAWLAPQEEWGWPPYLELEAGFYDSGVAVNREKAQIMMESTICRESGIMINRKVTVEDDLFLSVEEKITNCGTGEKKYGIWGVTQLRKTGIVIVPLGSEKTLTNLDKNPFDHAVQYIEVDNENYAIVRCEDRRSFKIGTHYSKGWIAAIFPGEQITGYIKKVEVYGDDAEFGHGCAFEVYNSPVFDYFEVETHAPMRQIFPGESINAGEKWMIHKWDRFAMIDEIIAEIEIFMERDEL